MVLVQVAEEEVEPLLVVVSGVPGLAEAPLAAQPGRVPGGLQDLGHRAVARFERHLGVPADATMAGVQPGHQDAPARGADRASGVALGEPQPVGGQAVDPRGLDDLLPVAADVAVPEVVG